jgi:hypothetical protein
MANLSIPVAKNVRALDGAFIQSGEAGGTAEVGDLVYLASDGDWEQSDASASSTAEARGIIVATGHGGTTVSAGDAISVVVFGPVAGFASLTPGAIGWTSDDAGKIEDAHGTVTHRVGYVMSAYVFFVMPGLAAPSS